MGRWGLTHFSEHLYRRDLKRFWVGIGTLGGGDYFRWDLKTPSIKNSDYKSQAKKMVPIVISTIPNFWSAALTSFYFFFLSCS